MGRANQNVIREFAFALFTQQCFFFSPLQTEKFAHFLLRLSRVYFEEAVR